MDLESWANEKYPISNDERSYHRRTPIVKWKGKKLSYLKKYHRQGLSVKQIARKLNCSLVSTQHAINYYIK